MYHIKVKAAQTMSPNDVRNVPHMFAGAIWPVFWLSQHDMLHSQSLAREFVVVAHLSDANATPPPTTDLSCLTFVSCHHTTFINSAAKIAAQQVLSQAKQHWPHAGVA